MNPLTEKTHNNIKISVILPIYNAEKTIKHMFDSLRIQTMSDFEVIMIDDGSTDSSSVICDEYAKRMQDLKQFINSMQVFLLPDKLDLKMPKVNI